MVSNCFNLYLFYKKRVGYVFIFYWLCVIFLFKLLFIFVFFL